MLTMTWRDRESGAEIKTRPRIDGDVFYLETPRSIRTGNELELIAVSPPFAPLLSEMVEQ